MRATYEIRAARGERLRPGDVGPGVTMTRALLTVLGGLPDQSALFGLLDRLRALGVEVFDVRRGDAATPPDVGGTSGHRSRSSASYEVSVPGVLGPALLAWCTAAGARRTATVDVLRVTAEDDPGIAGLAARLGAIGVVVCGIRRVDPTPCPAPAPSTEDSPTPAPASPAGGDDADPGPA